MTINLRDAAKWYKEQPHQTAAWNELQNAIPPAALKAFEELYRAAPAVKPAPPLQQPINSKALKVPYYSQRDSQVPGQAPRSCFSSSCAMLLNYIRPGVLPGSNGDDVYLRRVLSIGDTTDSSAQIAALSSYGVKASFHTNCGWADLAISLSRGVPVPIGILHHGPSSNPSGGGHWILVIGITDTAVIVNDPWGELDAANGGYINSSGAGLTYSKANLGPRWMAEGPGTGWAVIAQP